MGNITNGTEIDSFEQGLYQCKITVVTGPVLVQISDDDGASYQTIDDGSFAASTVKMIYFSDDYKYKFTLASGDTMSASLVEKGNF